MVLDYLSYPILMVIVEILLLKAYLKIIFYKDTEEWYLMTKAIIKECLKTIKCTEKGNSSIH